MYPTTKQEWWNFVERNQHDLLNLIGQFHPVCNMYNEYDDAWQITAPGAEQACQVVRDEIKRSATSDPLVLAATYIETKDPRLANLLNETWFGAPEDRAVMSLPGFGLLCDLCSESYLLYEEDYAN